VNPFIQQQTALRHQSPSGQGGRVLVFIVAYEAEKHIASVFEQIPAELYNTDRVHFLVIDDGSSDAGAKVASEWIREHDIHNVTVLRNPVNQGYGGNQKLGYRIGIEAGFDFIILLHGDGQYAPQLLPHFIETWETTGADVVLGSRMQDLRGARQGGMPWYKMIGNRLLTLTQNALTGYRLSEYHTGYRGYSTDFLRKVPFESNTNDFHFDTEILLQAMYVGAKIEEFAIPTRYGDEICRVNGPKYARDVVLATLQYKAHQRGFLCNVKYRELRPRGAGKRRGTYPHQARALHLIEKIAPARVLEVTAGDAPIAGRLRVLGIETTQIDAHELLADSAIDPFAFDAVLLLDVLEHLEDPEAFLVALRHRSNSIRGRGDGTKVIVSAANVAFAAVRLNLLFGRYTYAERGILDIQHKRLYTRRTFLRTLRECGYVIEKFYPIETPFDTVVGGKTGKLLGKFAAMLANVWPSLFAFQFVVQCHPLPGVRQILRNAEHHLIAGQEVEEAVGR
jgi:glycosyltransferase involved in cell wall biosynthesis